jgi:hypothetical protein
MMKSVIAFALLCLLSSPGFSGLVPECEAQQRLAPSEYDYYSLAMTSISNSSAEASKLLDIPQRVKLLMYAATLLPASGHEEAVRLLEVALSDLKEWISQDKATGLQRYTGLTLRNQVLAAYARLDAEKAASLQKEYAAETTKRSRDFSAKQNDWFGQLNSRRTRADQPAGIALSLLDTDPERAMELAARSLQDGVVSNVLCDVVKKLIQSGNRALLNRFENAAGQILAQNATLDPFSLPCAAEIIQSDRDMAETARTAFIGFFTRSLQNASRLVSEPGTNADYIRAVFTMFTLNARPVILQYAPEQLLAFDLLLDQVAPLVSEQTRTTLQAFQPEKFAEPRDRLAEILRDPNSQRRDLRLVRLVSELLRKEDEDAQESLDLAADAISGLSDPDHKAAFTDRLTITRINRLVKPKKFIEAQRLAGSISSEETRAWALLALSTVAAKADRVLGFELISNALKAIDKASPSPQKVELALTATAMLAKNDPQRAFDTFVAASRYANSSPSKIDPPTKPAVAFGLEATIGEAHTKLGVFPESLGELRIEPSLSALGTTDWFRADQIVNDIREPSLRLQLKLQFAGAVLAQESKSRRKEAAPKPSAKN